MSRSNRIDQSLCREAECWCHDSTALYGPGFSCSGCGCRTIGTPSPKANHRRLLLAAVASEAAAGHLMTADYLAARARQGT